MSDDFVSEISVREGVIFVNVPPQKLTPGSVFRLAAVLASAGMMVLRSDTHSDDE